MIGDCVTWFYFAAQMMQGVNDFFVKLLGQVFRVQVSPMLFLEHLND